MFKDYSYYHLINRTIFSLLFIDTVAQYYKKPINVPDLIKILY